MGARRRKARRRRRRRRRRCRAWRVGQPVWTSKTRRSWKSTRGWRRRGWRRKVWYPWWKWLALRRQ